MRTSKTSLPAVQPGGTREGKGRGHIKPAVVLKDRECFS